MIVEYRLKPKSGFTSCVVSYYVNCSLWASKLHSRVMVSQNSTWRTFLTSRKRENKINTVLGHKQVCYYYIGVSIIYWWNKIRFIGLKMLLIFLRSFNYLWIMIINIHWLRVCNNPSLVFNVYINYRHMCSSSHWIIPITFWYFFEFMERLYRIIGFLIK